MSWRDDDEIARLRAENERLRTELANTRKLVGYIGPERKPQHIFEGDCPDETQPEARDPYCWACMQLDQLDGTKEDVS